MAEVTTAMKILLIGLLCAVWFAIGVMCGRCSPSPWSPMPSGVASTAASVGDKYAKTIDECLTSNQQCIDMLKQSVDKADDYLTILEQASGKYLHNLPLCDAGRD